jgi:hypothetical protein
MKGNNTVERYPYPNARNMMATYTINNDYISLLIMPYDYRYSKATMTSQPLDTPDERKPSTSSDNAISGQPYEKIWNDI